MNEFSFYSATVPVFTHYLRRLIDLVERLSTDAMNLDGRLAPDTFSAGEHFVIAQGFSLRTVFLTIGRSVPDLRSDEPSVGGLRIRHTEILTLFQQVRREDFQDANRRVDHQAGEAHLSQDAVEYVTLFGLPNFFFHLTMGYATLRQQGLDIGKADFDGLHRYRPGFRFAD